MEAIHSNKITKQNTKNTKGIKSNMASKPVYFFFKRLMDIVCSLLALIVLSPLLVLVSFAIKIESKGPVVFCQKRIGLDGNPFYMYKFRSMCVNAEDILKKLENENEADGPVFKMKEDPRVTKVGKFIRKYSIDELLQLINILKGDMSIVGPRPALPNEVKEYDNVAKKRLAVKPGLTCYWQVMGRSDISFEEWMKLDSKYIDEMNLWLDIKLIFLTIPAVLKGEGAY